MKPFLLSILTLSSFPILAQQHSRLVLATSDNSADSTRYYYSEGRGGGMYDIDFLPFYHPDNFLAFIKDGIPPPKIKYDSLIKRGTIPSSSKPVVKEHLNQLFDKANNCIFSSGKYYVEDSGKLIEGIKINYAYDAQGNNIDMISSTGQSWHYQYDGNNNFITRAENYLDAASQQWYALSLTNYNYDSQKNLSSINYTDLVYAHNATFRATFNAASKLVKGESFGYVYIPSWLYNKRIFTFTYDSQGRNISGKLEGDISGRLFPLHEYSITYSSSSTNVVVTQFDWSDTTKYHVTTLDHNPFGQVTEVKMDTKDSNTGAVISSTTARYFYESYDLTTLTDADSSTEQFLIYPVPAQDEVTMNITWKEAQPFTVQVVDMNGRNIKEWNYSGIVNPIIKISVSDIPDGSYHLVISSKGRTITKNFIVLK